MSAMRFDFAKLERMDRYKLLLATVMPRPIAWTTTHDSSGAINVAPFSFFNLFSPDIIGISIGRGADARPAGELKDTLVNIRASREFVVNLVPFSALHEMVVTSIAFPSGVQESDEAGLTLVASERVRVPRILESPVSIECVLAQEVALDDEFRLMLGRVLLVHVKDDAVIDPARLHIDATSLDLIGRMEGNWYTRTTSRVETRHFSPKEWERSKSRAREN
jgi:flavin reductase (DIM6/NTAB) family NADH-FMN oxidoreductase RutF